MEQVEKRREAKRKSYLNNREKENQRSKDYYHSNKEELLKKQVEYRERNKERIAQRKKEYRERNKEKVSQQRKEYEERNKEQISLKKKEYRLKNREVLRSNKRANYNPLKRREEYEKNKHKISARSREYYLKNKEKIIFKHSNYRSNNKDKTAKYLLNRRYGIGVEEYEKMKLRQDSRCAICNRHVDETKRKVLCVDHDHKTGYVRGLLCNDCNSGIGFLKESEDIFLRSIEYLRKFKTVLDG